MPVKALTLANISGDDQVEVIVVLDSNNWPRTWVITQKGNQWRSGILADQDLSPFGPLLPDPENGHQILTSQTSPFGYAWDPVEDKPVLYELENGAPTKRQASPWPTMGIFWGEFCE